MTLPARLLAALALALALALAALGAPAAVAAPQRASLPDIEDEVMCAECGTALNVSQSRVADDEREFIRQQIAAGKTKAQIKQALVDRYGASILALPRERGFDLFAYLVPVLLGLLGLAAVAVAARRWRRARAPAPEPATAAEPLDPADARRLDAELAAFEG